MNTPAENLLKKISDKGWAGRIVPARHLAELREAIREKYRQGLLDKSMYENQLSSFSFSPESHPASVKSIIIVAVPAPQMRIFFRWNGKRIPVIIPPTYVHYNRTTENVRDVLSAWLEHDGFLLTRPHLPLKTLAVQSGLASYGKNNLCYVNKLGSFLQLVAACTNLPCDDDPWREPATLNRCKTCTACEKICPTRAIPADRFLLYAERCLTYHNEAANDFPDWIHPSWHHCLIGCMRCQTACPENKHVVKRFEEHGGFSEEETRLLIQRVPFDQLPPETASRIKDLEINDDYRILCRNLSMLIGREN